MDDRALHDTLETGGGLGLDPAGVVDFGQFVIEKFGQVLRQTFQFDVAGLEHGDGVRIFRKR